MKQLFIKGQYVDLGKNVRVIARYLQAEYSSFIIILIISHIRQLFENQTTGKSPQYIKTELQLFPQKCKVKLQKHLKIVQGEQNLLNTGGLLPTKSHTSRRTNFL